MRRRLLKNLFSAPCTEALPPAGSDLESVGGALQGVIARRLGRSLEIREVDAGSCNGCELEIHALGNAFYDIERFGGRFRRPLELWSHAAGAFFCAVLAFYSVRLVWQSHVYNDISQGNDATPLWIPQVAMAVGTVVLLVAMIDDFVLLLRRRSLAEAPDELKAIE